MRCLLTIPVFNEELYVERVLERVRTFPMDVLVVDDGSTDATPAVLRRFPEIRVLRHRSNLGYGKSLIDAFSHGIRSGYDWIITMDCDEQHEPAMLGQFLDRMHTTDADIISGSRYLSETAGQDAPPADRFRINRTVCDLLEQLLGLRLSDSFCGFKAYRVDALKRLHLTETGYAFPLQFWVQCARNDLKIEELPVQRIYQDPNRRFGGGLDDAAVRLQYYLSVLLTELNQPTPALAVESARPGGRRRRARSYATAVVQESGASTSGADASLELESCLGCRLTA